jgi:radical SAM protein with 4Fe4S-binding SPASM domain
MAEQMRTNPFDFIYSIINGKSPSEKMADLPVMPRMIDIELTNNCNFTCLFCHTGTGAAKRARGYMEYDLFEKVVNEITPFATPLRFIRWGEPLLHPEFLKCVSLAKSKKILCHVNTNGSLLDDELIENLIDVKLDSIKFSFQGIDSRTYKEMRYGEDYDALVDRIKALFRRRGENTAPFIQIATTVTYETDEQIAKFKAEMLPWCDLVSVGRTQLEHIEPNETRLPEELKNMLRDLKNKETLTKQYVNCPEVYDKLSINWDGTVSACCGDYDNYMLVGDMKKQSLREIWQSDKMTLFRQLLSENKRDCLPLCKVCYDTMLLSKSTPVSSKR